MGSLGRHGTKVGRRRLAGALLAVPLMAPASAAADETIFAKPSNVFDPTVYTIDQGERVFFTNSDFNSHNVASDAAGPGGNALFSSEIIGANATVPVNGAESLPAGEYGFFCDLHSFMRGTLRVTGSGTPAPGDTTAPTLALTVKRRDLDRIAASRRLAVRVKVSEAASVSFTARASIGGRKLRLGSARATFSGAATRTVRVRLGRKARRALAKARRARITVRGSAQDARGNTGRDTGRATLRG